MTSHTQALGILARFRTGGLEFRVWGLEVRAWKSTVTNIVEVTENQVEKNMENEAETGLM